VPSWLPDSRKVALVSDELLQPRRNSRRNTRLQMEIRQAATFNFETQTITPKAFPPSPPTEAGVGQVARGSAGRTAPDQLGVPGFQIIQHRPDTAHLGAHHGFPRPRHHFVVRQSLPQLNNLNVGIPQLPQLAFGQRYRGPLIRFSAHVSWTAKARNLFTFCGERRNFRLIARARKALGVKKISGAARKAIKAALPGRKTSQPNADSVY